MRCAMLVAAAIAAAIVSPAMASGNQATEKQTAEIQTTRNPTWNECYFLGWYRGVHVELHELPDWMEQCLAGAVPFDPSWALISPWLSQGNRQSN